MRGNSGPTPLARGWLRGESSSACRAPNEKIHRTKSWRASAPGLTPLRLPCALRSAPLTRAAIENDVWQHRRQCRRAPHARTHLDKGIISRQCRMRQCRLWTNNCTQNNSPGLVHTAGTLRPCVLACSCALLRVCAIYTYSKELCDVRV